MIAHWKALCEKSGASVYSGRNFLDARWEGGKQISLRVDEEVAGVPFPRGLVIELKRPLDSLNPGHFVFWGADEKQAILQATGEDENGDICGTGEVILVERGQLELFRPTGLVIDLE